jgi:hypothetical protein
LELRNPGTQAYQYDEPGETLEEVPMPGTTDSPDDVRVFPHQREFRDSFHAGRDDGLPIDRRKKYDDSQASGAHAANDARFSRPADRRGQGHIDRYGELMGQGNWSDAAKELEAIRGLVAKLSRDWEPGVRESRSLVVNWRESRPLPYASSP